MEIYNGRPPIAPSILIWRIEYLAKWRENVMVEIDNLK